MLCFKGRPALFGAIWFGISSTLWAQNREWEQYTPHYEDDAWYDVSEWLDGNDYNPTDEKFGRWDDEQYSSATAGRDQDNDQATTSNQSTGTTGNRSDNRYGYRNSDVNDRWFYDYWDPGYWYYDDINDFDVAYHYYDFDRDGLYDSYTSYYDWDQDGIYEQSYRHTLFSLSADDSKSKQAKNQRQESTPAAKEESSPSDSKTVSGTIENKKNVSVRGESHVVAQLKNTNNQMTIVDLGRQAQLQDAALEKGKRISVTGPATKVGDKSVVVAKSITVDGKKTEIDRQPRSFEGTIVETRQIKVRGQDHLLAVVNLKDGGKRLIDLGRRDPLQQLELKKDAHVIVQGVPVKVHNQQMVMGHTVEARNKKVSIDRRPTQQSRT
jgi:hypothetical protein